MSYLDDREHVWEIDPAAHTDDDWLPGMLRELAQAGPEATRYVLEGYAGLRQRFTREQASDAACFGTAMIWWFG